MNDLISTVAICEAPVSKGGEFAKSLRDMHTLVCKCFPKLGPTAVFPMNPFEFAGGRAGRVTFPVADSKASVEAAFGDTTIGDGRRASACQGRLAIAMCRS